MYILHFVWVGCKQWSEAKIIELYLLYNSLLFSVHVFRDSVLVFERTLSVWNDLCFRWKQVSVKQGSLRLCVSVCVCVCCCPCYQTWLLCFSLCYNEATGGREQQHTNLEERRNIQQRGRCCVLSVTQLTSLKVFSPLLMCSYRTFHFSNCLRCFV